MHAFFAVKQCFYDCVQSGDWIYYTPEIGVCTSCAKESMASCDMYASRLCPDGVASRRSKPTAVEANSDPCAARVAAAAGTPSTANPAATVNTTTPATLAPVCCQPSSFLGACPPGYEGGGTADSCKICYTGSLNFSVSETHPPCAGTIESSFTQRPTSPPPPTGTPPSQPPCTGSGKPLVPATIFHTRILLARRQGPAFDTKQWLQHEAAMELKCLRQLWLLDPRFGGKRKRRDAKRRCQPFDQLS